MIIFIVYKILQEDVIKLLVRPDQQSKKPTFSP